MDSSAARRCTEVSGELETPEDPMSRSNWAGSWVGIGGGGGAVRGEEEERGKEPWPSNLKPVILLIHKSRLKAHLHRDKTPYGTCQQQAVGDPTVTRGFRQ